MEPLQCEAEVIEWRGPSPYIYARLPGEIAEIIRGVKRAASYGWGAIPVAATLNEVGFTTSLFPKDGTYLLPLKTVVRQRAAGTVGDVVSVTLEVQLAGRP